jgi:hypothetical protein
MARAAVLVTDLQAGFVLLIGVLLIHGEPESASGLKIHTTRWIAANYIGPLVWIFVWMFDQARVGRKRPALAGAVCAGPAAHPHAVYSVSAAEVQP